MKQNKFLLFFVIVFVMLFAGCANSSVQNTERSQSSNSTTSEINKISKSAKITPSSETKEISEHSKTTSSAKKKKAAKPSIPTTSTETEEVSSASTPTTSTQTKKISESSASTPPANEKAIVSVDLATDELLSIYDSYFEFIEFEDENYQKIIFTTNIAIKNFRFIEIGFKDEDTDFTFFENKELYSIEELSPTKPFVVTWLEQGTIPHRGISFMDETGTIRYFYISMSGMDGSLLLVEF